MSGMIRKCLQCGKEFTVMQNGAGKKYCCKEHWREHAKADATLRWHNTYKPAREKKKAQAVPVRKADDIADIQRKARAAGMSYGKYVLAQQMGQIG